MVLRYWSDDKQQNDKLSNSDMDLNRKKDVQSNDDDSPTDGRFTNHTAGTGSVSQKEIDDSNRSQSVAIVEGRSTDRTTHDGDTIIGNVDGRSTDRTNNADDPMAKKNATIALMAAQIIQLQKAQKKDAGKSKDCTPLNTTKERGGGNKKSKGQYPKKLPFKKRGTNNHSKKRNE